MFLSPPCQGALRHANVKFRKSMAYTTIKYTSQACCNLYWRRGRHSNLLLLLIQERATFLRNNLAVCLVRLCQRHQITKKLALSRSKCPARTRQNVNVGAHAQLIHDIFAEKGIQKQGLRLLVPYNVRALGHAYSAKKYLPWA